MGITDRLFEESVGWSSGFLNKVKHGKSSFSVQKALRIFEVYPQLNIQWFFTGTGTMILTDPGNLDVDEEELNDYTENDYLIELIKECEMHFDDYKFKSMARQLRIMVELRNEEYMRNKRLLKEISAGYQEVLSRMKTMLGSM
ncbi:MAG: hypothetical protein OEY56_03880 [Cyclobacteriaceae bacterium]|nr:hypothetical protein [Cyclobacteriaceae bacterium]